LLARIIIKTLQRTGYHLVYIYNQRYIGPSGTELRSLKQGLWFELS